MSDVRLIQLKSLSDGVALDWLLKPNGALDESLELATAVTLALGTDRLASVSDELPDLDSDDRRGWWGDLEAEEIHKGWPIGSRLWLVERAKITDSGYKDGSLVGRIEEYITEALQPFVDSRAISNFNVFVTRTDKHRIEASIYLYRGPKQSIELRYQSLWDEMIKRPLADEADAPPTPIPDSELITYVPPPQNIYITSNVNLVVDARVAGTRFMSADLIWISRVVVAVNIPSDVVQATAAIGISGTVNVSARQSWKSTAAVSATCTITSFASRRLRGAAALASAVTVNAYYAGGPDDETYYWWLGL